MREPERHVRGDEDERERQRELANETPEQAGELVAEERLPLGERRSAGDHEDAERTDREHVVRPEAAREDTALERGIRDHLGGRQQLQREAERRPEVGRESEEVDPAGEGLHAGRP